VKEEVSVLVLRKDDEFSKLLRDAGLDVTNLPLITTDPKDDNSELRRALETMNDYDGVFFTSPSAAEVFVKEIKAIGVKFDKRAYAMGERARDVLYSAGIAVKFDDAANSAEDLIRNADAREFVGKRFLFVKGDRSLLTIPRLLEGIAVVDEITVYHTKPCLPSEPDIMSIKYGLRSGRFDWACFFSPSAMDVFMDVFGLSTLRVAAIGKTTAAHGRQLGLEISFISDRSSAEKFAESFIDQLNAD